MVHDPQCETGGLDLDLDSHRHLGVQASMRMTDSVGEGLHQTNLCFQQQLIRQKRVSELSEPVRQNHDLIQSTGDFNSRKMARHVQMAIEAYAAPDCLENTTAKVRRISLKS